MRDPYTQDAAPPRPAPDTWRARLRVLGPGVVISGSIVGSGELILTSSLGAAAGFVLLWWVLVSCWSKSLVQAELARYIVVSGDTYLRAMNRIPGRLPGPRGPVSWTLWVGLAAFVPGIIGMGGILGGTGQAVALLFPDLDSRWAAGVATLAAAWILGSGSYARLERVMVVLVAGFTVATLFSLLAMQWTPFALTGAELAAGMAFEFPAAHLVLALAVFGATGVNAAEISSYTYWCVEKGYAGFIGGDPGDPARLERARGWLRVLKVDAWLTLVILTCATVPFYLLGAGVLHRTGRAPQGLDTVAVLSGMFTETLGPWSLWLFGGAAFCILFSSVLAGFGGISRFLPDTLVEFGFLDRGALATRKAWTRLAGVALPLASLGWYLALPSPVTLLSVGALMAALLLPVQSGATLWLQHRHMDARLAPGTVARAGLWVIFGFQSVMAALVIGYVLS